MPYCLKPGRAIAKDIRRIADKQLGLAIAELRRVGDATSDDAVHNARRRVKKVRALIHLFAPTLDGSTRIADHRLRMASRLLAPIADGRALVGTVDRLSARFDGELAPRSLSSIRAGVLDRALRIDRMARRDRVLYRVAALLRAERRRVPTWTIEASGFAAFEHGLEESVRAARAGMRRVFAEPTGANFCRWRHRVKELWFQVRLLEGVCGGRLVADERRLEALDGCLGEYDNLILLRRIIVAEPLASRRRTACALRMIRLYQAHLRTAARSQGRRLFTAKPRQVVERVHRYCQATKARPRARASCRHAA